MKTTFKSKSFVLGQAAEEVSIATLVVWALEEVDSGTCIEDAYKSCTFQPKVGTSS